MSARDVEPLDGGHTIESIADHIDAVIPAIEIVDYRYESWTIGALQVAADNAIHGWWVHGEPVHDWRNLDLADCGVTVRRDGEVVTTGSGAAVLGHPLTVMAWLANELPQLRPVAAGRRRRHDRRDHRRVRGGGGRLDRGRVRRRRFSGGRLRLSPGTPGSASKSGRVTSAPAPARTSACSGRGRRRSRCCPTVRS